jgi:toluene monooxygenase system protein D
VLRATPFALSVITAIEDDTDEVIVHDEGAYLRVIAPRLCRLSRVAVEAATGSVVQFPGELEMIMSSFTGLLRMNEDGAVWWLAGEPRPPIPGSDRRES